jgi:hypothetical protein
MVNPVTGPFFKSVSGGGIDSYHYYSKSYRQKAPYNIPLPFEMEMGVAKVQEPAWSGKSFSDYLGETGRLPGAYAQAYSQLTAQLGETAGLGIDLTQWKQAERMISTRASQLTSFSKALLRRSPVGAAAALGVSLADARRVLSKRYGAAKKLSDLWLEFWFGWKPLVSDIHTAGEVLQRDVLTQRRIKGRGKATSSADFISPELYTRSVLGRLVEHHELGCVVTVTNPDVFLMQQFGVLNPLAVAWDAVPWSFVVDWFTGLGSWLGSFTDFAGLTVSEGYSTSYRVFQGRTVWSGGRAPYNEWTSNGSAVRMTRTAVTSFSGPPPGLHIPGLKPTRALTAITLLTQQLAKVAR